jgi:hypothetical protein
VVETPYSSQGQTRLGGSENIPGVTEKRDRLIIEFLTTGNLV